MIRVLLGIEDYNELLYLQTFLRKIGFDVDGVQNEKKFQDTLLAFNPEVVILSGLAKKGLGSRIIEKFKKKGGKPKVILLRGTETQIDPLFFKGALVDKVLDRPVQATSLIQTLADFGGLDPKALIEKYNKVSSQVRAELGTVNYFELNEGLPIEKSGNTPSEISEKSQDTNGFKPPRAVSTMSPQSRKDRFEKMARVLEDDSSDSKFDRNKVSQYTKKIRQEEAEGQFQSLDEDRKAFVKALFKKKIR